jgi:hypothetical protein
MPNVKIPRQDRIMIFCVVKGIDLESKHPTAKKIAMRENG